MISRFVRATLYCAANVLRSQRAVTQTTSPAVAAADSSTLRTSTATARLQVRPQVMATGIRTRQAGARLLDSATHTWIYVPLQCVGTRRVPLVIFLHGAGETANDVLDKVSPGATGNQ